MNDTPFLVLSEMTSKQVHEDNEVLSNTTFKLLKKYQGIRSIVKTLAVSFLPRCSYYLQYFALFRLATDEKY